MGFTHGVKWTGLTMTVDDLRTLVNKLDDANADDAATVHIHVDPRNNNPTDPGGTITVEVSY